MTQQRLFMLGLNHQTAPLEVREKLAFAPSRRYDAIEAFRIRFACSELVVLSTCNRVELYVARPVHGHPRVEELVDFIGKFHALPAEQYKAHLYTKAEIGAVEHLFSVACSLDSMVLGETQILGQVREAYDLARNVASAGAMLNPLFQRALSVGKQVMHETGLNAGRISIASVAVDYARRIFDHFNDKTVLCIGAGKMATLALAKFSGLKPQTLLICNRDGAKAAALATQFQGTAAPFDALESHLTLADIVISSTGSQHPIITRAQFDRLLRQRRYRPIFLIDIALPRDVEASVGELENVYLYNIDDLQQVVAATQSNRRESVDAARAIVARHVAEFAAWHRTRELGPTIDRLYKRCHEVAREELNRTLNKMPELDGSKRAYMEDLVRRIVNKLLHQPVQAMRNTDESHGLNSPYLHAMEKLFQLDDKPDEDDGE